MCVQFLFNRYFKNTVIYDSVSITGDITETIYEADGITIEHCREYGYLEVFGCFGR